MTQDEMKAIRDVIKEVVTPLKTEMVDIKPEAANIWLELEKKPDKEEFVQFRSDLSS